MRDGGTGRDDNNRDNRDGRDSALGRFSSYIPALVTSTKKNREWNNCLYS